jgi:hypothetical protein
MWGATDFKTSERHPSEMDFPVRKRAGRLTASDTTQSVIGVVVRLIFPGKAVEQARAIAGPRPMRFGYLPD